MSFFTIKKCQPESAGDRVRVVLNFTRLAIKDISMKIIRNRITAFIGPSGCGKSTLLRCFNRLNDLIESFHIKGQIYYRNEDLYSQHVDAVLVRRRIGMVFQKPNPFPKSIFENVAYGLRVRGEKNRDYLTDQVEKALKGAALWNEVKDRLNDAGSNLSGGQQQRLCIARALATNPEIILFDEPTSALDPIATASIEELIAELKGQVTMLIVTHSMQQAARVSDHTAFMYMGQLIEFDDTAQMFTQPSQQQTKDYVSGRFG